MARISAVIIRSTHRYPSSALPDLDVSRQWGGLAVALRGAPGACSGGRFRGALGIRNLRALSCRMGKGPKGQRRTARVRGRRCHPPTDAQNGAARAPRAGLAELSGRATTSGIFCTAATLRTLRTFSPRRPTLTTFSTRRIPPVTLARPPGIPWALTFLTWTTDGSSPQRVLRKGRQPKQGMLAGPLEWPRHLATRCRSTPPRQTQSPPVPKCRGF